MYLHLTSTSAVFSRVVLRYITLQMYWPESAADTLATEYVLIPLSSRSSCVELFCGSFAVLFHRSVRVPLCWLGPFAFGMRPSKDVVHVMTAGRGKLSTRHVRLKVSPSVTLVFPVISTLTSKKKKECVLQLTNYNVLKKWERCFISPQKNISCQ